MGSSTWTIWGLTAEQDFVLTNLSQKQGKEIGLDIASLKECRFLSLPVWNSISF